jgi:beta-aspartyl-peptidase (threonine type)
MSNKLSGRVGDSPLIGCGTYADNSAAAVSCTGHGELFMQRALAHDVCCRMRYGGRALAQAADDAVLRSLPRGSGGLIAVSPGGHIAMPFNTPGMFRGHCDTAESRLHVGIWEDLVSFSV